MSIYDITLAKVSANANNNKFYRVSCDGSSVTTCYGRIGSDGVTTTKPGSVTDAERIVRQKKNKGYQEVSVIGSKVADRKEINSKVGQVAKSRLLSRSDRTLEDLVSYLVDKNAHDIATTSGGKMTVQDGVVTTALGLVSEQNVAEARTLLSTLSTTPDNRVELLERYLMLIPQKIPARNWKDTLLTTEEEISQQGLFLDKIQASLDVSRAQSSTEDEMTVDVSFRYRLDKCDEDMVSQMQDRFTSTAKMGHSDTLRSAKVSAVYAVTDTLGTDSYDRLCSELGNVKTLWHGTRVFNVLSILSTGLRAPRPGDFNVTGAMFGPGTYFSDTSTKSAAYSRGGLWSRGVDNRWFMFCADVVAGCEYHPNRHGSGNSHRWADIQSGKVTHPRTGKPFNSVNVKAGTCGVINHEAVVWNPEQINLHHLVEFSSR